MSSKRGRKRNDTLPPNRARDVQRAFRARRAAHLEALEHRVAELEEENNYLRTTLNLPPANRPPLGKGPTGKDKPKSHQTNLQLSPSSSSLPPIHSLPHMSPTMSLHSAAGSLNGSPSETSTRTHSLSPESMSAALAQSPPHSQPSHNVHDMESDGWGESMFMPKEQSDPPPPVPPATYTSTSFTPSGPRQVIADMYMQSVQRNPHTDDRPMNPDTYPSPGYVRDDRRSLFSGSFSLPSFHTHNPQMQNHHPAVASMSSMSSMPPQSGGMLVNHSMPYPHRRSMTDQHPTFRPTPLAQMRLSQHPHALRLHDPAANMPGSAYDMETED
ncbi:hypothetical protein B0H21DRAFT_758734 [Amylocystis lapponica]|nr:hypothetical protein B0H21DRAFT_758734 [Amylocystis lapponica]